MSKRRRLLPSLTWAYLLLFAGASAILLDRPALSHVGPPLPGQRSRHPHFPGEVVARVQATGLAYHVVPIAIGNPDLSGGAYLCDRERPWGELNRLYPDLPKERWKGVVQVRRFPVDVSRDPDGFDGGPREVRGENLALFGDPEMIETILGALGDSPL
jgi:hypothetical protein